MIAVYYPNGRRHPGTLHKVRPDDQLPTPPAGHRRAKCGQILWSKDTQVEPDGKVTVVKVCRRCYPKGVLLSV